MIGVFLYNYSLSLVVVFFFSLLLFDLFVCFLVKP
jgi:hypothetical protein